MYFKTLCSKKKEYHCYFVQEKLFRNYLERETMDPYYLEPPKCISQLFGASKKRMTAISSQKNCFTAIWREKNIDPCYLENKKCSSQLFGASKNRMTAISS